MAHSQRRRLQSSAKIQVMNLLPIFNRERAELSIKLWNVGKAEREALKPRQRAEARRRLIKAARQYGIEIKVER